MHMTIHIHLMKLIFITLEIPLPVTDIHIPSQIKPQEVDGIQCIHIHIPLNVMNLHMMKLKKYMYIHIVSTMTEHSIGLPSMMAVKLSRQLNRSISKQMFPITITTYRKNPKEKTIMSGADGLKTPN